MNFFLKAAASSISVLLLIACSKTSEPTAGPVVQSVVRSHNYDVQDGIEYGYTAAVSDNQKQAGQVAQSIIMFSYAGERDGKHQVHMHEGKIIRAFECSAPCEVIKAMSAIDADGLRNTVAVERLRGSPSMIASMALDDAIKGKLQNYVEYADGDKNGRHLSVWLDEKKGVTRTLVKKVAQ